ncbi:hypothetical protein [Pelodictyon luteolum]|uniref:Uncharacterized protein n=1 Tax=Chlorobium luteolum (strain DSM 273 / BCRC 81028 / 2530) TaxID=319225 RepID=Q3B6Q6_CHLL3|nr:hypothetical protein [Pelodictyon luteolum]ABB22975.1 hypothetical protein Plut_0085 [Pelodictyon luteolum DSM 273]
MVKRAFITLLVLTGPGALAASPDGGYPATSDPVAVSPAAPADSEMPVDSLAVTPILIPMPADSAAIAGSPDEEPVPVSLPPEPEYDCDF